MDRHKKSLKLQSKVETNFRHKEQKVHDKKPFCLGNLVGGHFLAFDNNIFVLSFREILEQNICMFGEVLVRPGSS